MNLPAYDRSTTTRTRGFFADELRARPAGCRPVQGDPCIFFSASVAHTNRRHKLLDRLTRTTTTAAVSRATRPVLVLYFSRGENDRKEGDTVSKEEVEVARISERKNKKNYTNRSPRFLNAYLYAVLYVDVGITGPYTYSMFRAVFSMIPKCTTDVFRFVVRAERILWRCLRSAQKPYRHRSRWSHGSTRKLDEFCFVRVFRCSIRLAENFPPVKPCPMSHW